MAVIAKLRHGIPRVSAGRWAGLLLCAAFAVADGLLLADRSLIGGLALLLLPGAAALLLAVGTTARSTLPVFPVLSGGLACALLGLLLAAGSPARYAALAAAVLLTVLSLATGRRDRHPGPAEPLSAADREDLHDAYPAAV
ncbi:MULTISPECIES: hypothetical protein [unclassified Kitasatospora]|uniref:hypothetical protein n=1 Tax=unclassified Kitasatospora TaxID=2633591 RepID=UPI0012FAE880|nr:MULTISPECIES: hypothetical protein [unclassified Kitasatospora]